MKKRNVAKFLKVTAWVIAGTAAVFFLWNYLAGPLKYRRDMQDFAASLASCETSTRAIRMPLSGEVHDHVIIGSRNGKCDVRIDTLGPHVLHCLFPAEDLPGLSKAFADSGKEVGIFGGTRLRVSTSNPGVLAQAMNTDCTAVVE